MSDEPAPMTPSRPYMLRALHEWIVDNNCTPYVLVDAGKQGVQVPARAVKDGQVVLNVAPEAVSGMQMGNDALVFQTRFSGASMRVYVPVAAVKAVYAQETGQGMVFPDEEESAASPPQSSTQDGKPPQAVPGDPQSPPSTSGDDDDKPKRGGPHLRVIK